MDTGVPRAMFQAFSNNLPVRLGGLYAVKPPIFFRMLFPVVRILLKKKLQQRLHLLPNTEQLVKHFSPDNIPEDMGGTLQYDHSAYVATVEAHQKATPYQQPPPSALETRLLLEETASLSVAASSGSATIPDPPSTQCLVTDV
jgi:hypothetical protein